MDLATTPCFACHFGEVYNIVTMAVVDVEAIVVEPLDTSEYRDPLFSLMLEKPCLLFYEMT